MAGGEVTTTGRPRALAFYLPQFHPIPENDEWWGPGFTEWTNVVAARPLFRGHEQPHLPADLGFYDLRVPEVRAAQAAMARAAGIDGFVYYHYWFSGRRLLERPFDEVLVSGQPDFPFALCWANEAWTRAWDGETGQDLMPQRYSDADDVEHIRWLCGAFADPRYVRVGGKPLFLVYRASDLPDPPRTTDRWREEAARLGVGELFLARVESFKSEQVDPGPLGFDAAVEFQPDWANLRGRLRAGRHWDLARRLRLTDRAFVDHRIFRYDEVVARMLAKPAPAYPRFPCVTPRWDNTARRRTGATVFVGSTPAAYGAWLGEVLARRRGGVADELVFVNAWNEWAEGNHLEPDTRWGRAYLEATRAALDGAAPEPPPSATGRRRAGAAVRYRASRRRRRLARRWRDIARPAHRVLDRVPALPSRPLGAPPPAVLVGVYRRRNAAVMARLVDEARRLGWRVALWSLDGRHDRLAEVTVGEGPGSRSALLNRLVTGVAPSSDDHVVLADDDVDVVRGSLGDLVAAAARAGFGLAQPAHSRSSFSTHPVTLARPASVARRTAFVEIGPVLVVAPAWRDRVLPLPEDAGMGWGLELVWSDLRSEGCELGIVDAVRVRHRDPVAAGYDADAERARLARMLEARGLSSLKDVQHSAGTWRPWQPSPPWAGGNSG